MTEAWKSIGRHFCEICKVWMTDNKLSRDFHERGQAHQNMIKVRIAESQKKAQARDKQMQEHNSIVSQMEQAAVAKMVQMGEDLYHGPSLPTGVVTNYFDPRGHRGAQSMATEIARFESGGPSCVAPSLGNDPSSKMRTGPAGKGQPPEKKVRERPPPGVDLFSEVCPSSTVRELPMSLDGQAVDIEWVQSYDETGKPYYWNMNTQQRKYKCPGAYYKAEEYAKRLKLMEIAGIPAVSAARPPPVDIRLKNRAAKRAAKQAKKETPLEKHKREERYEAEYVAKMEALEAEARKQADENGMDIPLPPADQPPPPPPPAPTQPTTSKPAYVPGRSVTVDLPPGVPKPPKAPKFEESAEPETSNPFLPVEASALGAWVRVVKTIDKEPVFSPLTAKYREMEEEEAKKAEQQMQFEEKEPPIVFEEKTAPVSTKKTTKVVEFKKKGGAPKNVVENQRQFFNTGATRPLEFRKQQLKQLRKMLVECEGELADAVYQDHRRSRETTHLYEMGGSIQEIDYFIDNLADWAKPQNVSKTMLNLLDTPQIVKDPKGVTLIIAPWNYPICMITLPLIPALGAGNTVVIKPSEVSEHTAKAMESCIARYFDPRVVTVVNGAVKETTELLTERFDHILYTGCPPVAKIIMAAAAKHLTPVTLELGGKCPVIIRDDADIDISAKRVAWGKWMNCGQTCLAPDYVMVTEKSKAKFVESLRKYVREFFGDDVQGSKDYSRIISSRHFDRVAALLDKTQGKVLISPGERNRDDLFVPPTVLDVQRDDAFMEDEIFGPVLPILTINSFDEQLEYIREGEKPLAAYIFTRSDRDADRLLCETTSGGVTVNDVIMHLLVDTLPFGGVGNSGMGRYRGKFGFDTFSHEKSVLKKGFFGESLLFARYPPMTDKKFKNMQFLTGKRRGVPTFMSRFFPTLPIIMISVIVGIVLQKYRAILG
ncbi:unnamed protein product, partial [Mesorhabditis spiculigera]